MNSRTYRKGPYTPRKQKCFWAVAEKIFWAISAIYSNQKIDFSRPAQYFDFFAGRGRDPDTGEPGSPLIVAKLAKSLPYPIDGHLFENDPETVKALTANLTLSPFWSERFLVHPEDNMNVVDVLAKLGDRDGFNYYGLAYSDVSNGDLIAATAPLRLVVERQPRIDLLINYSAASWKRQIKLPHYKHAEDIVLSIGKAFWFIRKPVGAHQFTMLLGSNYKLPFPKNAEEYSKWVLLSSPEGREWFNKANFTGGELDDLNQPPLFTDDEEDEDNAGDN